MTQARPLNGDLPTGEVNLQKILWPKRGEVWGLTLAGLEDVEVITESVIDGKVVAFYLLKDIQDNIGARVRIMDLESFIINFQKRRSHDKAK